METISDADMLEVTNNAKLDKSQLRKMFVALGLEYHDIEKAENSACDLDYSLQAANVLRFWRQRNGNLATRLTILNAMKRCGFEEAGGILQEKWELRGLYMHSKTTHHEENMCPHVRPIEEDQDNKDTFQHPRGVSAIPAFMPYNILIQRITERLDEDPLLLDRLKTYCKSSGNNSYGIPSSTLEDVRRGKHFIDTLENCCLLSPGNLIYLQHILMTAAKEEGCQCRDLVDDIEEYGKRYPEHEILHFQHLCGIVKPRASGVFITRIKTKLRVSGKTTNFDNLNVPELLHVLHYQLGIPKRLINVTGLQEGCIVLFIQLPKFWNNCDIREKWIQHTTSKVVPEWICRFDIIGIHVSTDMDLCVTFKKELTVFRVKMLFLGSSGTGKSSLLYRFIYDSFIVARPMTVGIDLKTKRIEVGGKSLEVTAWDTAGQERFHAMMETYYRGAHGVMLVYDITCRRTFNNIPYWLSAIRKENENIAIVLCGNKKELVIDREITYQEACEFAQENDIMFLETSAKTGEGVQAAFLELTRAIATKIETCKLDVESIDDEDEKKRRSTVTLKIPQKKRSCRC